MLRHPPPIHYPQDGRMRSIGSGGLHLDEQGLHLLKHDNKILALYISLGGVPRVLDGFAAYGNAILHKIDIFYWENLIHKYFSAIRRSCSTKFRLDTMFCTCKLDLKWEYSNNTTFGIFIFFHFPAHMGILRFYNYTNYPN